MDHDVETEYVSCSAEMSNNDIIIQSVYQSYANNVYSLIIYSIKIIIVTEKSITSCTPWQMSLDSDGMQNLFAMLKSVSRSDVSR